MCLFLWRGLVNWHFEIIYTLNADFGQDIGCIIFGTRQPFRKLCSILISDHKSDFITIETKHIRHNINIGTNFQCYLYDLIIYMTINKATSELVISGVLPGCQGIALPAIPEWIGKCEVDIGCGGNGTVWTECFENVVSTKGLRTSCVYCLPNVIFYSEPYLWCPWPIHRYHYWCLNSLFNWQDNWAVSWTWCEFASEYSNYSSLLTDS